MMAETKVPPTKESEPTLKTDSTSSSSSSQKQTSKTLKENLPEENVQYFNDVTKRPFSEQAQMFLNVYWDELNLQAEFIYEVACKTIKYADMHYKGMSYIHLYEEGTELDFNVALYFYEQLCKKVLDSAEGEKWRNDPKYKLSMPEMQTAIVRKNELKDKVDINFDGKVSFLEYLLYQYRTIASPKDFTDRAMYMMEEHPEIVKARRALESVTSSVNSFEKEKQTLSTAAEQGGVKGMGAKHQLAIIEAGPLARDLDHSLINAEASLRKVEKMFKGDGERPTRGTMWWMNKVLDEKKALYGKRPKK